MRGTQATPVMIKFETNRAIFSLLLKSSKIFKVQRALWVALRLSHEICLNVIKVCLIHHHPTSTAKWKMRKEEEERRADKTHRDTLFEKTFQLIQVLAVRTESGLLVYTHSV